MHRYAHGLAIRRKSRERGGRMIHKLKIEPQYLKNLLDCRVFYLKTNFQDIGEVDAL